MLVELTLLGGGAYFLSKNVSSEKVVKYTKLLKDLKTALTSNEREQQQSSLQAESSKEIQQAIKQQKNDLMLFGGTLGFALLSPLSPLFSVAAIGLLLYVTKPFFELLWQDLKAGRIISVYMENTIIFLALIAKGYLVFAAIIGILGNLLSSILRHTEALSEQRLLNIFANHPDKVWIQKNGIEIEVSFDEIKPNDIVIVNAGEPIPVDGTIEQGMATIDQHLLTGESQPVERGEGEKVFASTLVLTGQIQVKVEVAGEQTVAGKIGHVLDNTQHYKDQLILRGKKIADGFMPITWAIAAITWPILGSTAALTVLFASLGLNMMSLGPLSVLIYLQILSRQGVLIKDGRVLESLRNIDTIVFDKTGTLTLEQPTVGSIHNFNGFTEQQVLSYAATAEYRQPHPIAKAILARATEMNIALQQPDDASYQVGYGIKVQIEQHHVLVGSARFMQLENVDLPDTITAIKLHAEEQGHSLIYISVDQQLAGILEMQPSIRPEAAEIIQQLKQRNIDLYIISGDHEKPTRSLANQLGIDNYFAETLPENKAELVKQLRDDGKFVCFIGDGINDAIALKSAQISISLKGASTAATDTAQIIFMDGTINHLSTLLQLGDEFEDTMKANLLSSTVPGIICIGGVYLLNFGLAAGMASYYIGTSIGVTNSLYPLIKHQQDDEKQTTVATAD